MGQVVVCFFFQGEEGIRGFVRARGVGNVDKRQVWLLHAGICNVACRYGGKSGCPGKHGKSA